MIWGPVAKPGDSRIRSRFAWLPTRLGNRLGSVYFDPLGWVWLQRYDQFESYEPHPLFNTYYWVPYARLVLS